MLVERRFQMVCDVARNQHSAKLARGEGRFLLVERAHADAFSVAEHRAIDRAGNVVFRVLGWRTHIDDGVKPGELCYGGACVIWHY